MTDTPQADNFAKDSIKRGFFWLGSANLVAQVLDILSSLVVILFITKAEMGQATLAWTVAVVIESFNGLGVGSSIVQKKDLSRNEVDSLFWFVNFFSLLVFGLIFLVSPLITMFFEEPQLRWMLVVSAGKLVFVGAALVPLQLLNKELKYRQVGTAPVFSTFATSLLKIGLAVAGLGAWALVTANVAYGVFTLIIVYHFNPLIPRLHFAFAEIRHHVSFGIKITFSSIVFHFYRNLDYIIIGKVFGTELLGVYRVAFDIAMTPATALLNVVVRVSYPVLAKLNDKKEELVRTFFWTQSKITFYTAGISVFLFFAAADLVDLIGKSEWQGAIMAIRVLSIAAFLRSITQTYSQVFNAIGRPVFSLYDSLSTLFTFASLAALFIFLGGARFDILTVCAAWVLSYVVMMVILNLFTAHLLPVRIGAFLNSFFDAAVVMTVLAPVELALWAAWPGLAAWHVPHLIVQAALVGGFILLYRRLARKLAMGRPDAPTLTHLKDYLLQRRHHREGKGDSNG